MLPEMPKSKQALWSALPFLLHFMLLDKYAGIFIAEDLCFCAVISSRACSSAWLERIPDKDEAGGSSPPRPTSSTLESGGISSAGRAPALQAGGQRFDPAILHQS